MASLADILKGGLKRHRGLDRRLRERLKALPRGSVLKRRIGQKDYYYLIFRDGERVVSRYLGKQRPSFLENEIRERRRLKRQLREVQENLRVLGWLGRRKRRPPP
jgi:hypothetical protein